MLLRFSVLITKLSALICFACPCYTCKPINHSARQTALIQFKGFLNSYCQQPDTNSMSHSPSCLGTLSSGATHLFIHHKHHRCIRSVTWSDCVLNVTCEIPYREITCYLTRKAINVDYHYLTAAVFSFWRILKIKAPDTLTIVDQPLLV